MELTANWPLWGVQIGIYRGRFALKHPIPDGRERSQEELHYRGTRRPETPYRGGLCDSERYLANDRVQRSEEEPNEAPQDVQLEMF